MSSILKYGRYLYAFAIAMFGVIHFQSAETIAKDAPGGQITVYIVGAAMILAAISIFIGKLDGLACFLLGCLFFILVFPHALKLDFLDHFNEFFHILRNIALAGGAFMCASLSKDATYLK
jgi:uncharacterized membrane protein